MSRSRSLARLLAVALAVALVPAWSAPAGAQGYYDEEDYGPSRVARISYVSGDVSVFEPEGEDWESADENTPLFAGTEIYADEDARAEIALGSRSFLRIANGADVTLAELESGWAQVSVASGTVILSLESSRREEEYSLSAPAAAVTPREAGTYRIDVADNGDTWVTIAQGSAEVSTTAGSFEALEGDVATVSYEDPYGIDLIADAARWNRDDLDLWASERDTYYDDLYRGDQPDFVLAFGDRDDIYGLDELVRFGAWLTLGSGVYGWQPQLARDPNWSPYQDGYWDYSTVTGWTWVSNEPWGWAPYHYGRWDYDDRHGWLWLPTHGADTSFARDRTTRYRWSPALVHLWQPAGGDDFAWVPLAPGERYVPFSSPTIAVQRTAPRAPATATVVPRHLRERRGVVVVDQRSLASRQKPRRVAPATAETVAPPPAAQASPVAVVLPKPARASAAAPARAKPSAAVRQRAVVVDPTVEAKPPRAATPADRALRDDAKAKRAERRAERRQLKLERKPATDAAVTTTPAPSRTTTAGAPPPAQPGRLGGRRVAPRARPAPATTTTAPDATAPATTAAPATTTAPPAQPRGRGRKAPVVTQPQPVPPAETTTAPPPDGTVAPDQAPVDERTKGKGRGRNKNKNRDKTKEEPADTQKPEADPPPPETDPPPQR